MLSTLLCLTAVPALAQALDTAQDNGLLRFPIRVSEGAPVVKNITKRQNEIALESQQTGFFYSIDIELGTPSQVVSVNFDTGSAELWVNPVCSKASDPEFCASFSRFTESSTVVDLEAQNHIVYGTGYADIEYVHDFVTIGSAKITQQIFGVAYDSEFSSVGILGAGPDINGWDAPYNLVIDNLLEQGFINSRAFSLDIQSIDSTEGAVIYGGLDTKKFSGPLEKLPIVPASESPDGNTRFWVNLNKINLKQDDGSVDQIFEGSQTVLLDSGYTLSGFPSAIFQKFLAAFPSAKEIPGSNQYEVDCDVADLDGTVDFVFGGTTIKVPYSEFIWQQPQNNICILGAFEDNTLPVLGDSFLRAAYVVYDWDNREIHLAKSEACGSNLIAIGSGPDAVPSGVGECGGSQTSTTSEVPTSTSTTSEPPTSTSTTSEVSTSTSASISKTETQSETETETETVPTSESTTNGATQTTDVSSSIITSTGSSYVPTTLSSTIQSSTRYYNVSSTHSHTTYSPTLTSTITSTKVYTITSCPPQVTNCPIGSVTTEVVTAYTTWCPESKTTKPPKITSTFTQTRVHTITSCPGRTKCTASLATEVITTTALVCPPTTATYTLHKTVTCSDGASGCSKGTKTYDHVVTVKPGTKNPVPTPVPGCSTCASHNNATATWYPTGSAPTTQVPTYAEPTSESTEPAVVTAGAPWNAPGTFAAIIGFILAVAI